MLRFLRPFATRNFPLHRAVASSSSNAENVRVASSTTSDSTLYTNIPSSSTTTTTTNTQTSPNSNRQSSNNDSNSDVQVVRERAPTPLKTKATMIDTARRPIGLVYRFSRSHLPTQVAVEELLGAPTLSDEPYVRTDLYAQHKEAARQRRTVRRGQMDFVRLPRDPMPQLAIPPPPNTVPRLKHGLDHVLHSPGVHLLRDERTRKYNFDPYLRYVHQPDEIDLNVLTKFTPSSEDDALLAVTMQHGCRFSSSTSSMAPILAQLIYLVSMYRPLQLQQLSSAFRGEPSRPVRMAVGAIAFTMRPRPYGYAIDSRPPRRNPPTNRILLQLGRSLESMLTLTRDDFESLLLRKQHAAVAPPSMQHSYHYLKMGDAMLRSQLDCYDASIPGELKTFDLKTRATIAVRRDVINHHLHTTYRPRQLCGLLSSFEREYYDMARSAFLKYNMQVRIGRMAGIFVAYHNTRELFGFEFLPQRDLDECLFGSSECGDRTYDLSHRLSQMLFNRIVADSNGEVLQCIMSSDRNRNAMDVWVEYAHVDQGWISDDDDYAEIASTEGPFGPITDDDFRNAVTGTVRHFRLEIDVLVNGEQQHGSYLLASSDALDVDASLQLVAQYDAAADLPQTYIDLLQSLA